MNWLRFFTGVTTPSSPSASCPTSILRRFRVLTITVMILLSLTLSTTFGEVIHLYIGRENIAADEKVFDLLNKYYGEIINITFQKHCKYTHTLLIILMPIL